VNLSTRDAEIGKIGSTGLAQSQGAANTPETTFETVSAQFPQETVTASSSHDFKPLILEARAERRKTVDLRPRLELQIEQTKSYRPELSTHQLADLLNFVTGDPHPEVIRANSLRRLRYFNFSPLLVGTWRAKSRIVVENWCDRILEIEQLIPERYRGGGRKPTREVPRLVAKLVATVGRGSW
jgi:hypothetical protein